MPGAVFLEGDRVELRTIELADAEFLCELINHPRVRSGIGSSTPVNGVQEREWIEALDREDLQLMVTVDGESVGTIGFGSPNDWGTTELGYMLHPAHWGRGYATEAVALVSGYGFEERRLNKLSASVYETNPASSRVLEKNGFREEGRLRQEAFVGGEYVDLLRYGLLAEEWGRE